MSTIGGLNQDEETTTLCHTVNEKESDESKKIMENPLLQNAFFDVIDCVEESGDDIVNYYSIDEERTQVNINFDEENKKDIVTNDFEYEKIYESNDGVPDDFEEFYIVEKPEELDEKSPLPSGWKEVFHESGALLYWHIETNVCSLSRPYFLGTGSTKTHLIPDSAIPCLYSRDTVEFDSNEVKHVDNGVSSQDKITNYCKRLFKLKKIKYLKFKSWDVRRSYLRTLRNERNRRKCPFSNNKFITFPIVHKDEEGNVISSKKWIVNPRGKSYVAILHEYLQQSLKTQPVYTFSEVDNARTPYAAIVTVNGDEYGTGVGMSKKEAKLEAAKATLLVLLPKMKKYILNVNEKSNKKENEFEDDEQNVASVFNDIEITDPRVTKLSKRTTEPLPYELLLKCLQKKGDKQEVKFSFEVESAECTMQIGEHSVTVQCDNKRDGKQQAAQALLQALHPYINNWGSLLRLYNNHTADHYQLGSRQVTEEKELEDLKNRSSKALLTTLRHRMLKLSNT